MKPKGKPPNHYYRLQRRQQTSILELTTKTKSKTKNDTTKNNSYTSVMLGTVNINLKPTTDILSLATTAALLDVRQYFNERDIVDLRTHGYLINDSFLLTDFDETTLTTRPSNLGGVDVSGVGDVGIGYVGHVVKTLDDGSGGGGGSGGGSNFNNNLNFIIFNQSGLIKNESNDNDSSRDGVFTGVGIGGNSVLPMPEDVAVLLKVIILSIVLGLMILITIIGR